MMFNTSGMGLGEAEDGGNGLGNLADELADALSDGEDEYYDQSGAPGISVDTGDEDSGDQSSDAQRQDGIRDACARRTAAASVGWMLSGRAIPRWAKKSALSRADPTIARMSCLPTLR